MPAERLQKIAAAAGIASRRKAEELITGGLVSVNGQTITELGSKADPESDHIRVNGKLLHGPESASVPSGTPRLCQRGPPATDERRRVRQPPDESRVPRAQNIHGKTGRQ